MQANAIAGPWAAGERVLVCISEHPSAAGLVRYAKRLADRLHAPWTALAVETARSAQLSEVERDRIADTLRLAERLGGEALTLPGGQKIAEDILTHAQAQNVTQIVIGKSARSRWFELLHGSVVHDLVRLSGGISVHVIAGDEVAADPIPSKTVRTRPPARRIDPIPYAVALLAVVAAFGVVKLIEPLVGIESLDLVFLTAIVGVAVRFGLWPSLFAVAAGSLIYNFFFLPPTYTFTIASPTNVAALVLFTVVAVLVSNLAAQVRLQAVTAKARARTTEELYAFSRKLAGVSTLDDVLWATAYQLASQLDMQVVLLLPDPDGTIAVRAGYPPEDTLEPADIAAAKWSFETNRPAGRGADNLPGARRLFMPLRTGRGAVGVVGLDSERPGPILTPEQRRLFDALSDQAAVAIERVNLVEDVESAMRAAEADRLRQALLTSISHDLAHAARRHHRVGRHAARLSRRPERGGPRRPPRHHPRRVGAPQPLHRQPPRHDPARVRRHRAEPGRPRSRRDRRKRAAARRPGARPTTTSTVDLADDLPMVDIDPVLFEQVLFNLLDNAAKYAPDGHDGRHRGWPHRLGRRRSAASSTRARASRRRSSSASSTSSTACGRATACAPAPASALRSAAASSRRWAAPSSPATASTARGRSSPSPCRPRARAPSMPHEPAPPSASSSSTTSRRSAGCCAPGSPRRATT